MLIRICNLSENTVMFFRLQEDHLAVLFIVYTFYPITCFQYHEYCTKTCSFLQWNATLNFLHIARFYTLSVSFFPQSLSTMTLLISVIQINELEIKNGYLTVKYSRVFTHSRQPQQSIFKNSPVVDTLDITFSDTGRKN